MGKPLIKADIIGTIDLMKSNALATESSQAKLISDASNYRIIQID